MTPMKRLNHKYDHALDSIYDLFKFGREKEFILESKVECLREEIMKIQVRHDVSTEIQRLCERALSENKLS